MTGDRVQTVDRHTIFNVFNTRSDWSTKQFTCDHQNYDSAVSMATAATMQTGSFYFICWFLARLDSDWRLGTRPETWAQRLGLGLKSKLWLRTRLRLETRTRESLAEYIWFFFIGLSLWKLFKSFFFVVIKTADWEPIIDQIRVKRRHSGSKQEGSAR